MGNNDNMFSAAIGGVQQEDEIVIPDSDNTAIPPLALGWYAPPNALGAGQFSSTTELPPVNPLFGGGQWFPSPFQPSANTTVASSGTKIKYPEKRAKMMLIAIGAGLALCIVAGAMLFEGKLESLATQANKTQITETATSTVLTGPTFGGTVLSWKYTEFQLGILKKVENGEKLSPIEEQRLTQIIRSSTEINGVVRTKFKNYYPSSN